MDEQLQIDLASDVFVMRRVSERRWAHLGGQGRATGWAGIVSIDDVDDRAIVPDPGSVLVLRSPDPEHRFGPYWSQNFVAVRVDHDLLVFLAGDHVADHTDREWFDQAELAVRAVTEVTPAKRLADELEVLQAVQDIALVGMGELHAVASNVLARIATSLSCEVGGLLLPDGELLVNVADGVDLDPGLVQLALRGIVNRHLHEKDVCIQDARTSIEGSWLRSYLVRSLGDGSGRQGVVVLAHLDTNPRGFTELCQNLASTTAQAAATVLLAAVQQERHRQLADVASAEARSDALTGLANRRAWEEHVAARAAAVDPDDWTAMIVCDVDGLKEVNDTAGHAGGDAHLAAVASVLQDVVRHVDVTARIGGDEFALLLPDTDQEAAEAVASRIRHVCRTHAAVGGRQLSLSMGVVAARGADELQGMLEVADATMYDDKRRPVSREDRTPLRADVVQPVVGDILRVLLHLPPDQVDAGIQESLATLGRTLSIDRCYVFELDGDRLSNTHEWCGPGTEPHRDRYQDQPAELLGAWGQRLAAGEVVAVADVQRIGPELGALGEVLREGAIQSLVLVPMNVEQELVGYLGFDMERRSRSFGRVALGLLQTVGDALAAVISRRRSAERAGRAERRIAELLRHSRDHVMIVDVDGIVSWASDSFVSLGIGARALEGRRAAELIHPEDHILIDGLIGRWLREDSAAELALPDHRIGVGDRTRWVCAVLTDARHHPDIEGLVVSVHDVTDQRQLTAQIRHEAVHDPLTGLPNRTLLADRLSVALERRARESLIVGLLFLDLDHFGQLNDTRGHRAGDELLCAVAERLQRVVRDGETLARFAGDQFCVVLAATRRADLERAAQRLTVVFEEDFVIAGRAHTVSASFGLKFADTSDTAEDVLQDADVALFSAKEQGRGRLVVFEPTMRARAVRSADLLRRLQLAVAADEVRAHYQPIVSLATGRIVGYEALARWTDAELGVVSPAEFIPVAEQGGLIGRLGQTLLRQACRDAARWSSDITVSVNFSPLQFDDPDLPQIIRGCAREAGIEPDRLLVEVTESLVMRDTNLVVASLTEIRRHGVRVALDDFGTGHSSLAILRTLPLDVVKIDRAFVSEVTVDAAGARMVDGIVSLAKDLGLKTVAEGIEQQDQADRLELAGCDVGQGWLYGRAEEAHVLSSDVLDRQRD